MKTTTIISKLKEEDLLFGEGPFSDFSVLAAAVELARRNGVNDEEIYSVVYDECNMSLAESWNAHWREIVGLESVEI